MAHQYLVANNWGKANAWIREVLGTTKTRAEAQAIVDTEVQAHQAEWDALSDEEKATHTVGRPPDIVLPE